MYTENNPSYKCPQVFLQGCLLLHSLELENMIVIQWNKICSLKKDKVDLHMQTCTYVDMERHTMFLDWKNHYCQNDNSTQGNLWIQYNPYQITTDGVFHRTKIKNLKIFMKTQKTLNSQRNFQKGKQNWRNQAP